MAMGCQSADIPNVRFYAEIPFVDCYEGAYVESLTKKVGIIKCEEWKKMRPYMLMVDPEGKKQIFGAWSKTCRGAKSCNVALDSVKGAVQALDKVAEAVLKPGVK